jgi:hypothetical protein
MASMEERNKTLVLEAFNTLFNKRDMRRPSNLYQPQASRLLALSGSGVAQPRCPLSGVKRTCGPDLIYQCMRALGANPSPSVALRFRQ